MKRILQVLSCLEKGGTEAYVMNNYKKIDKEKFVFDFFVFNEKDYDYCKEIEALGGNVFFIGCPSLKNLLKFIKNFLDHVKRYGPYDIVHAHLDITNALIMFLSFIAGIPVRISHSHVVSSLGKKTFFLMIKRAVINLFSTHKLACSIDAGLSLYGEKHFRKDVIILNNGIDVEKFSKYDPVKIKTLKQEFNIKDGCFVVGNITRFDKNKNIEFVVGIFNIILKSKPNSVLLLGGYDGGELSTIKQKVHELGIENSVRFIGVRNDVCNCLQLMDVYLFPSFLEGLPIAILEAQATGLYSFVSNTIPKEVDLGLGLVEFLDISKGAEFWANKIIGFKHRRTSNEEINKVFLEHGFSVSQTVTILEEVYEGKK